MLATNTNFKSSVNIKFDIDNVDFLKKYLPTPSHAEALQGILSGFNNPSNRRSHIVIGPYGTGKSMLGTLLASIVSKNISKDDFSFISNKFNSLDDEIYSELIKVRDNEKRYLPVILNGYEGKFKHSVLSSIQKTLAANNINIIVPGVVSKIFETIDNWKGNYPKTYKNFVQLLREENKDIDVWRIEILSQNSNEINWFRSIFPSLTSGAEFLVEFGEDFIEQVKYILDELDNQGVGLFIVYDEFGRYLQNLEYSEINETMQNLQDLAELTDHYSEDLHLLFITHKHLRHYFSSFNEEFQNEFQRIEKRFRLYYIDSDSSTFFRIAESVISSLVEKTPKKKQIEDITSQIRKYPLFQQLNQVEIENLIVKGTFPIHPVTLYLLPFLSSLYGQNERTLFTFLESKETNSLLEHASTNDDYYLPYKLFTYFFPSFSDVDFGEKDKVATIYKTIIKKIPDLKNKEGKNKELLGIIQFITLWELCGLQSRVKLSSEFIAFSFNMGLTDIEKALVRLEDLKFIRFNRILGYWELFEGSGYDIDELVFENSQNLDMTKEKKLFVLGESLSKKYYLAREYNDTKSMTRFASLDLVPSSDILNDVFNPDSVLDSKGSDAMISLVLLDNKDNKEEVIAKINTFSNPLCLYYIHPYPLSKVEDKIIKKYTLKQMVQNDEFLKNDKNLKKEIQVHLEDVTYELNKYMQVFYDFSSEGIWIIGNQIVQVKNEIILEGYLSQLMLKYFPLTPEIRNDGYNRRKLNNVQLKAGYKVVDHIINTPYIDHIGIEGNGPEYLIYASIFKNNDFYLKRLNDIKNKELRHLRESLLRMLEEKPSGNFADLVGVMSEVPYGIRRPNIPILLVSLLRDKWDQLLFYNNEMFISQMNGEILFSMVNEPVKYQYNFLNLSDEYNDFIIFLEDTFANFINENEKVIKPILVTSAMLKWLRSLPRFVQITRNDNEELISFKDTIRLSEIDPQKGLQLLFDQFSGNREKILKYVNELNDSYEDFRDEVINKLNQIIEVESYQDLKIWAKNQSPVSHKQNNLVKSILNSVDSDRWIENVAYDLVGVELRNWSDKTKEMFLVQVQSEHQKLKDTRTSFDNSIIINYQDRTKSIRKTELSTKSRTLYQNVSRILKNGGRNVPKEEIENIVLHLLEEFVE